jgi:hypothetical protein
MTSVVAGSPVVLTAEWRVYGGGPLTPVTSVTITITRLPSTVVVGPTSTGVSTPATGINAYTWSTAANLTAGSYLVTWNGVDNTSDPVAASEVVTVLPATGAWAPSYVDDEALADFCNVNDDNPYIGTYGDAACRAVDSYCNRQFGQLSSAETWTYDGYRAARMPTGKYLVMIDDVQDTSGMTVTVDGTEVDDWQLWERNAAGQGRPYTGILLASAPGSVDVAVHARFGWNAVPPAVPGAVWLQVNRWNARRQSPYGVAGSPSEGSEVRLSAVLDPDVRVILAGGRLVRKRMPQ